MLTAFIRDVRFGARMLLRSPGFSTVVIISLALGIGANTAVLSVLDEVLWRTLPVDRPEQLVLLQRAVGQARQGSLCYPAYSDLSKRSDVFESLCASGEFPTHQVRTAAGVLDGRFSGRLVTSNYFEVLGVSSTIGRLFHSGEREPVCVLSYTFWDRQWGKNPAVLGTVLSVNEVSMIIVGVTRPGFFGDVIGQAPDFYLPMEMQPSLSPGFNWLESPRSYWLTVLGRLQLGWSRQVAEEALQNTYAQSFTRYSQKSPSDENERLSVLRGSRGLGYLGESFAQPLYVLLGVVILLLMISCGNLANLLLARTSMRQKEMNIRVALGAGRSRIIRQVLAECTLLSVLGTMAALVVAVNGRQALVAMASDPADPIHLGVGLDWRIFAICLALGLLTTLLVALIPALRVSQVQVSEVLNATTAGAGGGPARQRLGKTLIAFQVALSVIMLTGTILMQRTVANLRAVDTGFQRDHVLLASFRFDSGLSGLKRLTKIAEPLEERLNGIPFVQTSGFSTYGGLSNGEQTDRIALPGRAEETGQEVRLNSVSPGYFEAYGIPLLQGRTFHKGDTAISHRVVIINQSAARLLFPNQNPLGKTLSMGELYDPDKAEEIVGVVKDAKWRNLREVPSPTVYELLSQNQAPALFVAIRTRNSPELLMGSLRTLCHAVDPQLTIDQMTTLEENVNNNMRTEQMLARLSAVFGFLALIMISAGIYGIISYSVERRKREIGIRMVMGADGRVIRITILREVSGVTTLGIMAGLPVAIVAARVCEELFFGVTAYDPWSIGVIILVLCLLSLGSTWIPAQRACRLDPMVMLRCE